jgi:DMSO/TMAO reductase YedYZ molybdopterin-dependent catalytic subunit
VLRILPRCRHLGSLALCQDRTWLRGLRETQRGSGQYSEKDISPYFWHNGQYPDSDEYKALFDGHFADYRLRINGLVDNAVELDLAQLRALPHHEQITQHFCIQGWSGVAKWGGVSMQTIVDLVEPRPEAKWVVFYSLGDGADRRALTARLTTSIRVRQSHRARTPAPRRRRP